MTWFGIWHSEKSFLEASWRGLLFSPTALPFSARQVTWSLLPLMPSIHKTLPMIFFFFMYLSPNHTEEEHGSVFWGGKGCPALQQMGKPPRQPSHFLTCGAAAVPYPCDMSSLLHSWSSREHKTHYRCFSREAMHSFTHLRGIIGRGHRSRQEQSSRSSASNSATCLKVICFPSPVLPSVKCQESDFGLHFPVLWDVLMWSPTQELDFTIAAFSV